MCFGLVMLYSASRYEADADFGNDLYYFTRQALIGAAGFRGDVYCLEDRLPYLRGVCSRDICICHVHDGLGANPSGADAERSQKMDPASGEADAAAGRDYEDRGDPVYFV